MSTARAPQPLAGIGAAVRSPLADTRQLAAVSGPLFPVLSLLVRLPLTMLPLGVLTAVALISGSPALGTLCAGAVTAGSSLSGLAMGATSARRRPGLVLLTLAEAVAVWWLLRLLSGASAETGTADAARLVVPCLLAGLLMPQMGVACRMRWRSLLARGDREDLVDTALRHESVTDCLGTVLAAVLTGLVTVALGPAAVPVLAAALTVAGTAGFLLHPSARLTPPFEPFRPPPVRAPNRAVRLRRRRARRLRQLPVVGMGALGSLMGSTTGSVVVFATAVDAVASISWLYTVGGLAAAVAAVAVSARPEELRMWNRWVAAAAAAVLAAMLLSLPDEPAGMVVALAITGLTIGPCLVAVYGIARLVVPGTRATALTTVLTAAMSGGLTVGLVLSGWSGEAWGHRTAALVPVGSAAVLLATGLAFVHRWRRTVPEDG